MVTILKKLEEESEANWEDPEIRMKIFEIITGICILVFDVLVAADQFMKVIDIFTEENAE